MAQPTLNLYRTFLRHANKFDNYNFREYSKRKIMNSFRDNKSVTDKEEISKLLNEAEKELAVLKRQAAISQMYTFDKLVVEPLSKKH